jgi:ABC-2 type transport system permease protein
VNWEHFRAFLWLRWRIRVNQLKRGGTANLVIMAIFVPFLLFMGVGLFIGLFFVGWQAIPLAKPPAPVVMYVFDGLIVAFLFAWAVTLLAELQRAEVLSIDKFLHLPVSIKGVYLINYLSSLVSLNLAVFVPAMLGLCLGLALGISPAMLLLVPVVFAFVMMITALTYQFQGWLASLMINPRRRKTVIVLVTMGFVLLCQLPNLINFARPWKNEPDVRAVRYTQQHNELSQLLKDQQITPEEFARRSKELSNNFQKHIDTSQQKTWQQVEDTAWFINLVLPPGWLALAGMSLAEGNVVPALLGMAAMTLIGYASLWRSYRTTLRLYTGHYTGKKMKPVAVAPAPRAGAPGRGMLERELPWVSEQVSAITLASFRSLVRAPEAKMMLLAPIIMVVVFGSMFVVNAVDLPELVRPLVIFGGMSMVLIGMIQLVGNQFGFDRNGFRVFVLCAAPRRDILMGKNLAVAPFAFALATVVAVIVEVVYPMRIDHLLATWPQMVSMFFLFSLVANFMSIMAPTPIAAGSLKPANPKLTVVLLQMLFLSLMPMFVAPLLVPLGLEFLLDQMNVISGVPIYLILSLLICCGVVGLYRLVLTWQGQLLQWREQKILEIVTTKVE